MPIKPENKKLYPKNWKQIREDILKRANDKCEKCGVENHRSIFRLSDGDWWYLEAIDEYECVNETVLEDKYSKLVKIVLTIAHIDQDPTNNDYSNLLALCQKCHFELDRKHNLKKSRKTREKKQLQLI